MTNTSKLLADYGPLLSADDVAEVFQVSVGTVRQWVTHDPGLMACRVYRLPKDQKQRILIDNRKLAQWIADGGSAAALASTTPDESIVPALEGDEE